MTECLLLLILKNLLFMAFKYRDERDPKFPYKDEEPFLSDEADINAQIIKVDGKKVAVTVGNI